MVFLVLSWFLYEQLLQQAEAPTHAIFEQVVLAEYLVLSSGVKALGMKLGACTQQWRCFASLSC
jgi:hypothetical protein